MGNRSNIYIQDGRANDMGVYIYSHWGGLEHLQNGLDALASPLAQERWRDSDYLTRIIVQHILDLEGKSSTGFGIAATFGDNEHDILVIDTVNQTVALVPEGLERHRIPDGIPFENCLELLDRRSVV